MNLWDIIYYYYNLEVDERTKDWFLVGSPLNLLLIFSAYLYFIKRCGPRFMEKREPYKLDTFVKCYNIFLIIYNAWLVYATLNAGWLTSEIGLGCEPVNRSREGKPYQLAVIVWWAYMSRYVDFIETFVFVFKKKWRQISFLHVYHHITSITLSYIGAKYYPGGMATFYILVNCSVHVIMYGYYFLTSFGDKFRDFCRSIKSWITIIQMVQFWLLFIHSFQALLPSCPVPSHLAVLTLINLVINFFLFFHFYRTNYVKPKKQ